MIRLLPIFLFVVVYSFSIQAQEVTVLESETNTPIPEVYVYSKDSTHTVITDFNGKANLSYFKDIDTLVFTHVSHLSLVETRKNIKHKVQLHIDPNQLSEVVISASKWKQSVNTTPRKVTSIRQKDIDRAMPQTSADLLENTGVVYVQKSQLGGGSPMIRGFSTNRLLITVDGVRMNNAIFRGGNVQNVISIDPFSIDRTEVLLGSGTVIYGSDALGGVMNFYTKQPKFGLSNRRTITGEATARYGTATGEKASHGMVNFGFEKWALQTNISYTDFDDLVMGSHGPEEYLRSSFVRRIDGMDTVIINDNPEKQIDTGYDQWNFMQKVRYRHNDKWDFTANFIYTATSDYPRYDRLIRKQDGQFRSAEWFYGPQRWLMTSLQARQRSSSLLFDQAKYTVAYQNFQESRNDRSFGEVLRSTTEENVDAYSINIDFEKSLFANHRFHYGLEYIGNEVGSEGTALDIESGLQKEIQSRYPNGSTWQSLATYGSYLWPVQKNLTLQAGVRYNHIFIDANFEDTLLDLPFSRARLNTNAVTGSVGLNWTVSPLLQWRLNYGTAFRAPNIDDIGKVFDSEPGAVVVPNPTLKSEYAYQGEIGVKTNVTKKCYFDFSFYQTYLNNALIRDAFTFNGRDTIGFGGEESTVLAIQNGAQSRIYGFEALLNLQITNQLKLLSNYSITKGEDTNRNGDRFPTRHVPPQFGSTHLQFQSKKFFIDAFARYNGQFDFEDLAPSEQNKPFIYAQDENGNPFSPSWYTFNLRTSYTFSPSLTTNLLLENITDQRYRQYSSGIAAAGRNLVMSLTYAIN